MRKLTRIFISVAVLLVATLLLLGRIQKMTPVPQIQAWIYPGIPACNADNEIGDGRSIETLKPQYYTLSDTGTLAPITTGCNSYSAVNVTRIKAHSSQQFVTIAGSITGIEALSNKSALTSAFTTMLLSFLHTTGFTGVELDIEGYSAWAPGQYSMYQNIVKQLGTILHAAGFKLMLDGPAIINTTYQGYYPWKYEDFNTLPVDYLVSMCYDLQYDNGVGTPVASFAGITGCCQWMLSKVSDQSKIIIGLNSYGYHGRPGTYTSSNDTYEQSSQYSGIASATRDTSSGEMMWTNDGTFYDYSDSTTLSEKLQTVLATGLSVVSIWHLGGNQWFSSPSSTPTETTTLDPALTAFSATYPGFAKWYEGHFDGQGNYLGS